MTKLRPLVAERGIDLELRCIDDDLRLLAVDRAHGVEDRSAGPRALGRSTKQLELKLRKRLGAPSQVGSLVEDSQAKAGRVDQRTVEVGQLRRKSATICDDDLHAGRAEPARRLHELPSSTFIHLNRHEVSCEHRRLAAWSCAEVEDPVAARSAHRETDELRRAARRPDPALGERSLVDAVDHVSESASSSGRESRRNHPTLTERLDRVVEGMTR
jgi:hypothetical protein